MSVPVISTASTPPVQLSLLFTFSENSSGQNTLLTLLFSWTGYVSYNKPPEYIIVEAFNSVDGPKLGAFPVSRTNDRCEAENSCTYSATVSTGNFPEGKFMLIATDSLSGATNSQLVTISTPENGRQNFFTRFEEEQTSFLVSGVLAVILVFLLIVLLGKK
jgi:hypothetical protein